MFTDTHCHLYANHFISDRAEMIQRAEKEGVTKFYLPAIDSETHAAMLQLEADYPGKCLAMMGVHPCSIKEDYKQELDIAKTWLDQRKFTAVGEIGLDFYWSREHVGAQYEAFRTQMDWALEKKIPIVIHTRNAMQETINEVKPYAKKGLKGIFHCFSGSYESAQQIIGMDFLLGIGGVITYKNAGLSEVLEKIDLQHLVLETDAPYLTPVPFRGKRNESSYLIYVIDKLAEVKQCTREEIGRVTSLNAAHLFV
jgi:TatD DNase family protein